VAEFNYLIKGYKMYNCKYCGEEFKQRNKQHFYCSITCKRKAGGEAAKTKGIDVECNNCGKIIKRKQSKYNGNAFCCRECEIEYRHIQTHENRICPICNKTFETAKITKQIYCSLDCLNERQKRDPYCCGEKNPNYRKDEPHEAICEWCGETFKASPYKIKSENFAKFCSKKCSRAYYSQVWSQQESWKESRRLWAVEMLESGKISKTLSAPQVVINNLLNEMKINFINEKSFNFCAVDNYLTDYELVIEVMGTYWHCDNRKFDTVRYKNQKNRIKLDKIKKSYFFNNFNTSILYLWEKDIMSNPDLCEKLIKSYIDNKGLLRNYNSMNYIIKDNELELSKDILIPYMDWDIEKLNEIVIDDVKQKSSKKQLDKWITFKCEQCGEEKEELISHYNNSERHFCSMKCMQEFRKSNEWHREATLLAKNNKID
jgi:hypothetical protein